MADPISEFPVTTANADPFSITGGPDGNLWFTEVSGNKIGRTTPGGTTSEFAIPTSGNPGGIAAGADRALWFTEIGGNRIGRISTGGAVTEFAIPTAGAFSHRITAGSDGALWFTETGGNKIGRITLSGSFTEFALPSANSEPFDITTGPDGALWFAELGADKIGRITTNGSITEFQVPTVSSQPAFITTGPDGSLWFTEAAGDKIGRITTAGVITEFAIPTANAQPQGIAAGSDGNLWFAESNANRIGEINTSGAISEFALPTPNSVPFGIVAGPQGNLWFTEFSADKIGEIAPPPSPPSFDASWTFVGAANFNNDGRTDLAFQHQPDGAVDLQIVNGVSAIGQGAIANTPFDRNWSAAGVGDFNGDGTADLVYRRQSDGRTEIQLLNANTPIGGGQIDNNPFDTNWNIAGSGDFNGDGKSDLVWQRPADGLVEIQLLDGTQSLGGGLITNSPFDSTWQVVGAGNFNGDGLSDLVYHRASDGLTEIQFLNGTTPIGGGVIANNPFDNAWEAVGIGDFNGDGHADLVYRRPSDGLTEIQFLNGTTPVGGGVIANSPFDNTWQVVGVGDFNGDGHADLVYRRPSDGLTEIQLLNGTMPIGGGVIS